MIRLIDEIHQELDRLRYTPCPEELNSYPDGLVLCFGEFPGQDELCRVSEIGPPGRVTCLFQSRKVLNALKEQERGGDWYRAMRQMVDPEGTAPMEYVSSDGCLLLSTSGLVPRNPGNWTEGHGICARLMLISSAPACQLDEHRATLESVRCLK